MNGERKSFTSLTKVKIRARSAHTLHANGVSAIVKDTEDCKNLITNANNAIGADVAPSMVRNLVAKTITNLKD